MTVYLLIYAVMVLMLCLFYNKNVNKEQFNKIFTVVIFISLVLIVGLRHPSMGHDLRYGSTNGYLGSFDIISKMSWERVFSINSFLNYERGFIVYCKLVSTIWNNQQFFLFISAFVSLFPIFLTIYKKSENSVMSALIYMGIPAFLIIYSGIRQGLAIGLCFAALNLVQKKRPILFIISVLLISTVHSSAVVFLAAYPLYYIRLGKIARLVTVGILPIVYLLRNILFRIINSILNESVSNYSEGAVTLFLVFCAIYVFCIFFGDSESKEQNGYMNIFFLACVSQAFAGVHDLSMRIGYYFMIVLVLLLPSVVNSMKIKNNKLIADIGVNFAFAVYGIYSIYSSTWPMAYPYYFFFETVL